MKFLKIYLICILIAAIIPNISFAKGKNIKNLRTADKFAFREKFLKKFPRLYINTTREDAVFLRIMIESRSAKRGVEVGSANGYGAMHMGMGFEYTGGKLYTIEIDSNMAQQCRKNIEKLGLEKSVKCITGDALKVIPKLKGTFDFVFIDAVKSDYYRYFKAIEPKLKRGAIIVADNVIKYAAPMQDFLNAMEKSQDYDMVIIRASEEKHDGMAVIVKKM